MDGDGLAFDWGTLVPVLLHPAKVAIIEALRWVGQPLSASDICALIDDEEYYLSSLSYHAVKLAEAGAIEVTRTRQVRGAQEKFYFFVGTAPR
jgi:DNA-binding transcriptional ArsR family regulator